MQKNVGAVRCRILGWGHLQILARTPNLVYDNLGDLLRHLEIKTLGGSISKKE